MRAGGENCRSFIMVGAPERRCEFEKFTGNEINYDQHANAEEILSFMTSNGMIDLDGVAASMKKTEEERILNEHPYKITCGKHGLEAAGVGAANYFIEKFISSLV